MFDAIHKLVRLRVPTLGVVSPLLSSRIPLSCIVRTIYIPTTRQFSLRDPLSLMLMYKSMEGVIFAWGRCPGSQEVSWNLPSGAHPRSLPGLEWICHHSDACNGCARVFARVFLHFSFIFALDFLLQLGVLSLVFQRLLALVVVVGDHGASKSKKNIWTETARNKTR